MSDRTTLPRRRTSIRPAADDQGRRDLDRHVALLHADLGRMARRQLAGESWDYTLDSAALVNEAYLRLARQRQVRWQDGAHVLGIAACCMRRIRIDTVRRRQAIKRPPAPVSLDEAALTAEPTVVETLAAREALEWLATCDERQAAIVELRFFEGCTVEEIAQRLGVSHATAKRGLGAGLRALKTRLEAVAPLAAMSQRLSERRAPWKGSATRGTAGDAIQAGSRRTVSGENAGRQTATYSAPSSPGVL